MKKLLKKLRETKLAYKIIVVNIALMIVPFTIVGIFSYDKLEDRIQKQFLSDSTMLLHQNVQTIADKSEGIAYFASTINFSLYIENFLREDFHNEPEELARYKDMLEYIQSLLGTNDLIKSCSIYYENETIPENWDTLYRITRLDPKFLEKYDLENGKAGWFYGENTALTGMHYFKKTFYEKDEMVFVQPLYTLTTSQYLGILKIGVSGKRFFSNLLPQENGNSFLVVNEDGKVIFDPGSAAIEILPWKDEIQDGYWFDGSTLILREELPQIKASIYMLSSMKESTNELAVLQRTLTGTMLVSLLAASVILWMMISLLMRRINRVTGLMKKVSKGNFTYFAKVGVMDEAGEIASTFNYMIDNVVRLQDTIVQRERAAKDAEINALQAQINPHFIYNILEVFRIRLENAGQHEISEAMMSLGKMLRYSTNWSKESRLSDELLHLENYIRLQKINLEDRVRFYVRCEGTLSECYVPKMILQPLVENSIVHGLREEGVLNISVSVSVENGELLILVFDDGLGMEKEYVEGLSRRLSEKENKKTVRLSNIGIANINDRIRLRYGGEYGLSVDSQAGLYTKVTIRLPYCKERGE